MEGYQENRFIGRTIGRVTKAITDGIITIVSKKNSSSENYDKNNRYHFNNGLINFDNVNWDCHIIDKSVVRIVHDNSRKIQHLKKKKNNVLLETKENDNDDNYYLLLI